MGDSGICLKFYVNLQHIRKLRCIRPNDCDDCLRNVELDSTLSRQGTGLQNEIHETSYFGQFVRQRNAI